MRRIADPARDTPKGSRRCAEVPFGTVPRWDGTPSPDSATASRATGSAYRVGLFH